MTEHTRSRTRKTEKERRFGEWPRPLATADPEVTGAWELPEHYPTPSGALEGTVFVSAGETWPYERVRDFMRAFREHHKHTHSQGAVAASEHSEEIKVLRERLEALQSRVSRIEVILEGVDDPPYVDPDMAWCEDNLDKLRAHPDSFVAIDTRKGEVVVSAADQDDFIAKMRQLEPDIRRKLLTTHTSAYLKANGN